MRDHHEGEVLAQFLEGIEVLFPEALEGFVDAGQLVVRVEVAFAESGEVLAGAEDVGDVEPVEKAAGVERGLFGIGRYGARGEHAARRREIEIDGRGKVGVEAESADLVADKLAVFLEEILVA